MVSTVRCMPTNPGGWTVHIAIDPQDIEALRDHASRIAEIGFWDFIEHDDDSDEETWAELALSSRSQDLDAATDWARESYVRLRRLAGLGEASVRVVSAHRHDWGAMTETLGDLRDRALLQEAERLVLAEHYEWAVVAAQVACEVRTVTAVSHAMAGHGLPDAYVHFLFAKIERTPTLTRPDVQAIFKLAFGKKPTAMPRWKDYDLHLKRRHSIVHAGHRITQAEARDSLEICGIALGFIDDCWIHALEMQGRIG